MVPHPPLKSKYTTDEPSEYEILVQRHLERNEKARLRMARKRAALKSRPPAEQAAAAERERRYQARYRERNRNELRIAEAHRRLAVYKAKHGPELMTAYLQAMRERRRRACAKQRAKEAYDSRDDEPSDRDDEGCQASPS